MFLFSACISYKSHIAFFSRLVKRFQGCDLDPLLDDTITFACQLRLLSVEHHLVMIHKLPHGFLNFINANQDCKQASDRIMSDLARRYNIKQDVLFTKKKKTIKNLKSSLLTNPILNESI